MALRTRFTELFGLTHPLMSAPMVMHSGGRLAGAVSAAGALGAFGGMHPGRDPDWLHDEMYPDDPLARGVLLAVLEQRPWENNQ